MTLGSKLKVSLSLWLTVSIKQPDFNEGYVDLLPITDKITVRFMI